ncbi:hypothetical protein H9L19_00450 [Weissella diestrammenae]|uniref:Uncharacterized protein n=1 Tax=Weissella diestrammenae TaxID=1162633 RepID=A0A7G9T5N7_9LACO|nr:DUF5677 domain-containing protein [Weissella diestrammenae]MCM0582238.1 hypothetical protein [Weissella diestrammenae]QNN75412.1 hypothetical protein H9L19_00450 [Weissella diestrammenae]
MQYEVIPQQIFKDLKQISQKMYDNSEQRNIDTFYYDFFLNVIYQIEAVNILLAIGNDYALDGIDRMAYESSIGFMVLNLDGFDSHEAVKFFEIKKIYELIKIKDGTIDKSSLISFEEANAAFRACFPDNDRILRTIKDIVEEIANKIPMINKNTWYQVFLNRSFVRVVELIDKQVRQDFRDDWFTKLYPLFYKVASQGTHNLSVKTKYGQRTLIPKSVRIMGESVLLSITFSYFVRYFGNGIVKEESDDLLIYLKKIREQAANDFKDKQ